MKCLASVHFFYVKQPINVESHMYDMYSGEPVGMWTQGRVHTKFWQSP